MKKEKILFLIFFICSSFFMESSFAQNFPDAEESDVWNIPLNSVKNEVPLRTDNTSDFELLQNRFGGITIIGYKGTDTTVIIPETIGGLPVTIIGTKAFYHKDLSAVTIPETVVAIEPLAFAENQLQTAEIPGCMSIAYEAFAGNQLNTLVLSDRLSSIGPRAFINNQLSELVLPGRITNIGKDAFAGNPLSSITVSASRNLFASQGFEISFVNYYISTGRKAGVYTKDERIWALKN